MSATDTCYEFDITVEALTGVPDDSAAYTVKWTRGAHHSFAVNAKKPKKKVVGWTSAHNMKFLATMQARGNHFKKKSFDVVIEAMVMTGGKAVKKKVGEGQYDLAQSFLSSDPRVTIPCGGGMEVVVVIVARTPTAGRLGVQEEGPPSTPSSTPGTPTHGAQRPPPPSMFHRAMAAEHAGVTHKVEILIAEVDALKEANTALSQAAKVVEEDTTPKEVETLKARVAELQREVDALKAKPPPPVSPTTATGTQKLLMGELTMKNKKLQHDLDAALARLADAPEEGQLELALEEVKGLRAEVVALQARALDDSKDDEVQTLRARVAELEKGTTTTIAALKTQKLQQEIDALKSLQAKAAAAAALQVGTLQKELDALKEAHTALQATAGTTPPSTIAALKTQKLQQEIDALKSAVAERDERLQSLNQSATVSVVTPPVSPSAAYKLLKKEVETLRNTVAERDETLLEFQTQAGQLDAERTLAIAANLDQIDALKEALLTKDADPETETLKARIKQLERASVDRLQSPLKKINAASPIPKQQPLVLTTSLSPSLQQFQSDMSASSLLQMSALPTTPAAYVGTHSVAALLLLRAMAAWRVLHYEGHTLAVNLPPYLAATARFIAGTPHAPFWLSTVATLVGHVWAVAPPKPNNGRPPKGKGITSASSAEFVWFLQGYQGEGVTATASEGVCLPAASSLLTGLLGVMDTLATSIVRTERARIDAFMAEHVFAAAVAQRLGSTECLTRVFDEIVAALHEAHVPVVLVHAVVERCIAHLNATLLSAFLSRKELCCVGVGQHFKQMLASLVQWMSRLKMSQECRKALGPIRQACDVLMLPKETLVEASVRATVCPQLSVKQVLVLLVMYHPDRLDPKPVPCAVVTALQNAAQGERDVVTQLLPVTEEIDAITILSASPLVAVTASEWDQPDVVQWLKKVPMDEQTTPMLHRVLS